MPPSSVLFKIYEMMLHTQFFADFKAPRLNSDFCPRRVCLLQQQLLLLLLLAEPGVF